MHRSCNLKRRSRAPSGGARPVLCSVLSLDRICVQWAKNAVSWKAADHLAVPSRTFARSVLCRSIGCVQNCSGKMSLRNSSSSSIFISASKQNM